MGRLTFLRSVQRLQQDSPGAPEGEREGERGRGGEREGEEEREREKRERERERERERQRQMSDAGVHFVPTFIKSPCYASESTPSHPSLAFFLSLSVSRSLS